MSFRRWITALAVLALFAGLASAQVLMSGAGTGAFQCSASVAVPFTVRAEGATELVGDIVVACMGGAGPAIGSPIPTANITVSFGTNATSRLLTYSPPYSTTPANTSEALLLIDEPGSGLGTPVAGWGPGAAQVLCGVGGVPSSLYGAGTGGCQLYSRQLNGNYVMSSSPSSAVAGANVFAGVVNANQVTFYGIPVMPPVVGGVARVFRMTNIRVNASALGLGPVQSSVSVSGASIPIIGAVQTAGYTQSGLTFQLRTPDNLGVLTAPNFSGCVAGVACPYGILRFSENFGTAFKTRVAPLSATVGSGQQTNTLPPSNQNVPGTIYNSESGFISPLITGTQDGAVAGLADYGTRLKALFSNVPTGAHIWVATSNTANPVVPLAGNSATSFAQLVSGETAPESTPPVTATGSNAWGSTPAGYNYFALQLVSGSATAVWEVANTNPATVENFDFPVWIVFDSGVTPAAPNIAGLARFARAAPFSITNVTSSTANGTYGVSTPISIQATFGGTVTVTGTPQLALNSGGTANYSSGSGTSTLTFTYTVGAGENNGHLDYTSTGALSLNGGTIKDAVLNDAFLTLPAPGAAGSLGANKSLVIATASTDLVVTSLTGPNSAIPGGSINVSSMVLNQGSVGAGAFRVEFYFSPTSSISPSTVVDTTWGCAVTSLAPGASYPCSGPIGVPASLTPGTWYLAALADAYNQVGESNENNNWRIADSGPVTVGALAVTADSVTPSSGSGATPSFAAVYSDGNGYSDLTWTRLQVSATMNSPGACDVGYLRTTNMFYLVNDAGNGWLGPIAASSSGTLQNSQCVLYGIGSSAVGSGSSLTVTASLGFMSSFAGAKTIYLDATGSTGLTSGWVSRGAWTVVVAVGAGTVTADSVTPSSGSGSTPSFAAVYSDGNGYADLTWTRLQMVPATGSGGACDVGYLRTTNMFYLVNDAGNGWLGPIAASSSGTLQNTQCVLNGSGSSALGSGSSLTVTASLSFSPSFGGAKTVYLYATGSTGLTSGWVSRGTWTAVGVVAVTADSVTPSSGSGSAASFAAVYSDGNGYADLTWTRLQLVPTTGSGGVCDVGYLRTTNMFYLVNDAGNGWLGPIAANSSGTLQNSQCVLNGSGSSAVGSGNSLTVTASLSFMSSFAGAKTIYLYATGSTGLTSGWVSRGTWTAAGVGGAVTADSVTPSSGSGSNPSFAAVYSDGNGYGDLTWTRLQVVPTTGSGGVCDVGYLRTTNMFYLVNDAGNGWLGPIAASSSGTVQNSQCVLNGSGSSAVGSGNSLTVTASLSFMSSFAGAKTIYLYAVGSTGLTSGWVSRGTWTASGAVALTVTADSVTPSSGSGSNPSFVAVYSDGNGYADLIWTRLQVVSTTGSGGVCDVGHLRTTNMFYLVNDAGNGWLGPIAANSPNTLQNSQCVLNGTGSSAVGSGNSLTVTTSLSFMPAFSGAKTIYLYAEGSTGLTSGWVSRGTWTAP